MTNLFLLLLCFINLALYIGDPHVQIIVVFYAVSERLILTPERFRCLIQAFKFILEVIYHGRCIPELMQLVLVFGKNQCVVLLQRRTARIEKSTKLVSHESLRLFYTFITQPESLRLCYTFITQQDTVVLNIRSVSFLKISYSKDF